MSERTDDMGYLLSTVEALLDELRAAREDAAAHRAALERILEEVTGVNKNRVIFWTHPADRPQEGT